MRIGIFIKKPENIFSNGCIQQTYFLKKLFENCEYDVDFLSIESHYTNFELTNEQIIFTNNTFDFSSYNCVILGSLVLLPETNKPFIDNLLSYNIQIINLICGNVYILHQEEFVFQKHNILTHYRQDYFTENWVLEMYNYAKDYVQMVSSTDTLITPYVWDIDIIKEYIEKNNIFNTEITEDNSKVNLLIFEPNMSIHKNALVPLLICDEYYKQNKDKVNKVYIFCGDKVVKESNFVKQLDISKDNKLETYARIIMPYIVDVIQKNNNFRNIVVSYNILNNLNFLHLEMFYLGFPIIHNCKPFEKNGLYFDDFELLKAVELIETVRIDFDKMNYVDQCKSIIEDFSPTNQTRISTYKALFSRFKQNDPILISRSEKEDIYDYIDENIFYQGSGSVFFLQNTEDLKKLQNCINILSSTKEKHYIEIFLQENVNLLLSDISFNELMNITILHHNVNINLQYVIKNSSFKEVKYTNVHESMQDIKVYTK
tara:strand:- start:1221 stop:2678 length:1458 start_codon:yes stop_codon:yes gene_type:complete